MSELVPAAPSLLTRMSAPAAGGPLERLRVLAGEPAVRRALPWIGGLAVIGGLALTWSVLAPAPQRVLYSQLDDAERASVVDALDKASIAYRIDGDTGALTVDEDNLYRARMLVASDGALAAPDSGSDMLDKLPMGASRTLETERVRAAKEHELALTIMEIDGVEGVRVHLAEGEKSVFVRENAPPSASVMLRLARGRQLSDSQVLAIVNLAAGSVPGLTPDAVRVVDQHGRLLSQQTTTGSDALELQARMEEKLRAQVAQLLTPMLGAGSFSSEIQVDLDMDQVTSARESYDKDGALRSETQEQSQSSGAAGTASGVPGVLSNTPPPQTVAQPGAPRGSTVPPPTPQSQSNGESSASRTYELGREVAVSNRAPGKVRRISVAVALSSAALKGGKPTDIAQLKQLISAAVGADAARGDQVEVMVRAFDPGDAEAPPIYEAPWFATVLRNVVALIAVLLVLLLGVRPIVRALKRDPAEPNDPDAPAGEATALRSIDPDLLNRQVSLAQQLVAEKPESAALALRQMLGSGRGGAGS